MASTMMPAFFLFLLLLRGCAATTFVVLNNCGYPVWPALMSSAGTPAPPTTGFFLPAGGSHAIAVDPSWSGRLWGRTLCNTDDATGRVACATGDCSTGTVACSGSGAQPPVTLAEFTLNGTGGNDFYDVSLVDGFNVPLLLTPQGGGMVSGCAPTGCLADINSQCPSELRIGTNGSAGGTVACRSACDAFGTAELCCVGAHGGPQTCGPSRYSKMFKAACPRAYSYAYDDATSTFTCAAARSGAGYTVAFCPTTSTSKKSSGETQAPPPPVIMSPSSLQPIVFLDASARLVTANLAVSVLAGLLLFTLAWY